ncbi:MAG: O-linked N-acetylglucosamine transferase family protein, partial [Phycisphaerales bacterium]
QILARVPRSRFLVLNSGTGNPANDAAIRARIASCGLPPERVIIKPGTPGSAETLRAYRQMDIELDTMPFVGPTTNCEALLMGVPFISLVGDRHASRVGLTELQAIGRPEWAAFTPDEFVEKAVALALDRPRLIRERSTLRSALLGSPLCDGPGHARRFERAIRDLIRTLRTAAQSPARATELPGASIAPWMAK